VSGHLYALVEYFQGKDSQYQFVESSGKQQGQSGHVQERRHFLPLPGIEHGSYGYPGHCIFTVLTELFQFEIVWFFNANVTTTYILINVEILQTTMQVGCEDSSDLLYRGTAVNDGKAELLS